MAGCYDPAPAEQMRARQLAYDPYDLWSVRVVGPGAPSSPVKVCANNNLRAAFRDPRPDGGGAPCRADKPPVITGRERILRCQIDQVSFVVQSTVTGDPARAFDVAFSAAPVYGGGPTWRQTRRYQRLGPCPEGWEVGDNTDRTGKRLANAVVHQTR
ncbi:MAG: hypothetical protein ABIO39_01705 [Caulobacteraceae bacterium]